MNKKTKIKIKQPARMVGMTDNQEIAFKSNINMAFLLAHLADGFFIRAEDALRESGNLELDIKTDWKHAVNKIRKVTLYTDETLDKDEANFYEDLKFLDALMLVLMSRATDDEKQKKVLNMVKCMNL